MKKELEFVVNSFIFYCSAKWLVLSGITWMILRHYYRLYAIHKQNRVGVICVNKNTIYWMNISWMCEDCMPWRWIDTQWMIGRKEGRTFSALDSNPFNDVYSIYMLSVILIMRTEWERDKLDWWECVWLWFGIGFGFCKS